MLRDDIYQALTYLNQKYIPFPTFDAAVKAIFSNLELYRQTGIARHIFIGGYSGAGKSSLCDWMKQQLPIITQPDRNIMPCVVVKVPTASISGIAEAVLVALNDPSPAYGSNTAKTRRIITLCKACKVELILFDEAQHIRDRGRQKTHYMVGDWIKTLIDALNIPIVFIGLPRFLDLLEVNEQLRRRITRNLSLALGQSSQAELKIETFQLFNSLTDGLQVSIVFEPYGWQEMGSRLFYASDGLVAHVKHLLMVVLEIVMVNEEPSITPATFEAAFKQWKTIGEIDHLNPFHPTFEFRRLDRPGEPFYTINPN